MTKMHKLRDLITDMDPNFIRATTISVGIEILATPYMQIYQQRRHSGAQTTTTLQPSTSSMSIGTHNTLVKHPT